MQSANIICSCITHLLETNELEFQGLGSLTLQKQTVKTAIEPDSCYYIKHELAIRGKHDISLDIDPPPDLAVEIDIYSPTDRALYAALGVPELWIYNGQRLEILVLQGEQYQSVEFSPHFPGMALRVKIPALIERGKREGRMAAMKAFRAWVDENPA